ncbi:MAG: hypothetical protein U0640_02670 [Phycisphaerales bacterium]
MAKKPNRDSKRKTARKNRSSAQPARRNTARNNNSTDVVDIGQRPTTPDELHSWLVTHLNIRVPRTALIEGNCAPFDYLQFAFFGDTCHRLPKAVGADITPDLSDSSSEGPGQSDNAQSNIQLTDCVVWANRGGGKTFLGAVATLLDLLFKPGIEIRILGGSMEQSRRMHAHLRRLFDPRTSEALASMVDGRITERKLSLKNGSEVELLAQSHTSVRGTRVQKLRCDEVDLFDREVWEAAQLTTRSKQCGDVFVQGSVECLSTMHVPHGVMHELVQEARAGIRKLFRWGVVDALEHCPPARECPKCVLMPECAGKAKSRSENDAGHIAIDDAISMKRRVAVATWESEMLCLRPTRSSSVLPEFDSRVHVVTKLPEWIEADVAELSRDAVNSAIDITTANNAAIRRTSASASPRRNTSTAVPEGRRTWIAGMDFGYRAPTVVVWACVDERGVVWVTDEYVATGRVIEDHVRIIANGLKDADGQRARNAAAQPSPTRWPACEWIGVDPAGNNTNDHTGVSSVTKMRQAGIVVKHRRMNVSDGLNLVRARLAPAAGDGENNGPRLYIHERCGKLIESLERYHYPEDDPESDSPVKRDGFDHAVDALRYMIANLDKPHKSGVREY